MPNPSGKNQHNCVSKDDPRLERHLRDYAQRGIQSASVMKSLLEKEGIQTSVRSIHRKRKELGLQGSGATTRSLPDTTIDQLVLEELEEDPLSRRGPGLTREAILHRTGIHLTQDVVKDRMKTFEPEGFKLRQPTEKKMVRGQLTSPGPNYEWSADGHDKLTSLGFPIYGVRDKWSGKWLGLWVVPNNRLKMAVAYLYLQLLLDVGGMPRQSVSDCGSETVRMFALAEALREAFSETEITEAAHKFMRSVRNITIERGWFHLKMTWGDNIKIIYDSGKHLYNSSNPTHFTVHEWLWPKFIQQELDEFREKKNDHKVRYDKNKILPSGVSPNIAYTLYERYGATNGLITVDRDVIRALMAEIGEDIVRFVTREFEERAEAVFEGLGVVLSKKNIWSVFVNMVELLSH